MTGTLAETRARLEELLGQSRYQQLLGLRLLDFDPSRSSVTISLPYGPTVERGPDSGQFHGGAIASLIDIAGDYAVILVIDHGVPTINLRVDFLRPAMSTELRATATARRVGRTVAVVDIEVVNTDGKLVALGRGCYGAQAG
jgi:uncharacterized protein (TIGR00369 family)